jgi:hypothetical protein
LECPDINSKNLLEKSLKNVFYRFQRFRKWIYKDLLTNFANEEIESKNRINVKIKSSDLSIYLNDKYEEKNLSKLYKWRKI